MRRRNRCGRFSGIQCALRLWHDTSTPALAERMDRQCNPPICVVGGVAVWPSECGCCQVRCRCERGVAWLRLACCNPRLVQDTGAPSSSKLATFAETLDELLANRHKVLVFSQFVKHLKLIEEYLAGAGVAWQYLDGSTPARARAERIAAFQAGRGDVFLISLKAGGVGLNLTAANYVIHMDP